MSLPPFTCATCVFFSPNLANSGANGQCRRRAPLMQIFDDGNTRTVWPLVRAVNFCGDHSTVAEEIEGGV